MRKRIAYYGGTFDPIHVGHLDVARGVIERFRIDEFNFVPAFHAPHKKRTKPTSAFHRFAMISLALEDGMRISDVEVSAPTKPYTIETLTRVLNENTEDRVFFVIGADSWEEITTWRRWEKVLTLVDIVVVTRPGYEIDTDHVTNEIRERVVDLRGNDTEVTKETKIYFSDAAFRDVSATQIRKMIRSGEDEWRNHVVRGVESYIEKHEIY